MSDTSLTTVERVVQAWRKGLPGATPAYDDNFFAIGGDSLSAMRVVAYLRADGIQVNVGNLITHPTPTALARYLEQGEVEGRE